MRPSAPRTLITALFPRPLAGAVAGLALALGLAFVTPGSPITLWRADASLGSADPAAALALYDDVAAWGWTPSMRRAALRRGAALLSGELARPDHARERLERLVALEPDPIVVAELSERIAHAWNAEHDHEIAVRWFIAAAQFAPSDPRRPDRLVLAGRAATEAGRPEIAEALWERIAQEYPSHRGVARLAQGRSALAVDDPQRALLLFDEAVHAAASPDQVAAARLGVSTALERLGNLDEAIAELDAALLPDPVRGSRLDSLRARRGVRGR